MIWHCKRFACWYPRASLNSSTVSVGQIMKTWWGLLFLWKNSRTFWFWCPDSDIEFQKRKILGHVCLLLTLSINSWRNIRHSHCILTWFSSTKWNSFVWMNNIPTVKASVDLPKWVIVWAVLLIKKSLKNKGRERKSCCVNGNQPLTKLRLIFLTNCFRMLKKYALRKLNSELIAQNYPPCRSNL